MPKPRKHAETSFPYQSPDSARPPGAQGDGSSEALKRIESKIDDMAKKQDQRFKELTEGLAGLPDVLIQKLREAMTG